MVCLKNHFYTFMILHPVWDVLEKAICRNPATITRITGSSDRFVNHKGINQSIFGQNNESKTSQISATSKGVIILKSRVKKRTNNNVTIIL